MTIIVVIYIYIYIYVLFNHMDNRPLPGVGRPAAGRAGDAAVHVLRGNNIVVYHIVLYYI